MTVPSVSIVVLNHNYERYVGEALASATSQEPGAYRLAEVLVVDDGSTDGSHRVYEKFPGVRVVGTAHQGFESTLTRGFDEAVGDWVAPLDGDDSFTANKLRTLAPHLSQPDLLFVQHAEYVVDEHGNRFGEGTHPGGSTSTLMVRRHAARDLLPVTNELFFHVLDELGHGVRLPQPLTRYRVHQASMTDRRTPGVFADYMAGVCEQVADRLESLAPLPPWGSSMRLASLAAEYRGRADSHRRTATCQRQQAEMRAGTGAHV
ncbi:MAG: glycosyltransferase family 2 protein [Micromonosporaceae bacterium]|nr:glycosyltransferase family 2 protein [Micromonosporaceae bacterium]